MNTPNYAAIIEHLTHGTPLFPENSIEQNIVNVFKKNNHQQKTEGSYLLKEFDPDSSTEEHQRRWNQMILASFAARYFHPNEIPVKEQPKVLVVQLIPTKKPFDDPHVQAFKQLRQLGDQANDVMGDAYVWQLKKGII